jgi:zinc resistance-associated protein
MWKIAIAGATALTITSTSLVYAQEGYRGSDRAPQWRPSAADIIAFGDARIAAVHAGLKLTPEQEKNWPAVESALRDLAKQRSERIARRAGADRPTDPIERMNRRANAMTQLGGALKKLAEAAGPLYKSLDDAQKHRFVVLAHLGGRGAHGRRSHDGWWHHSRRSSGGGPRPL